MGGPPSGRGYRGLAAGGASERLESVRRERAAYGGDRGGDQGGRPDLQPAGRAAEALAAWATRLAGTFTNGVVIGGASWDGRQLP